jgi:tRNA-2-methylthio-N6-dimethylallyladenosine synthase
MKRVYIETYGCQMNVADSALMAHLLAGAGFLPTTEVAEATLVLVNTCAIRERASERVIQRLRELGRLKRVRPDLVLGVTGCVPKHRGEGLLADLPEVDLFVGPDSYRRLPELVAAAARRPTVDLRLDGTEDYAGCDPVQVEAGHAFVPVMRGCDRFCSFCVVPLARGREKSLFLDEVLRQVGSAVARGARTVTLLGQTVNSYHHGAHSFADLLDRVSRVEGLPRVRFTSPHPADFREEHFRLMAERSSLCPHLHLPVQSGADRVLAAMKRGYSRDDFLRLVEAIRRHLPEASLTTDLMVGFPGETDSDFADTLALMRSVEFDAAFLFRYSERDGTFAARHHPDDVVDAVKGERLARMIALQEEHSARRYARWVGREVEVLVEGPSRRDPSRSVGMTPDFKRVVLPGAHATGSAVRLRVAHSTSHTLLAEGVGSGPEEVVPDAGSGDVPVPAPQAGEHERQAQHRLREE